MKIICIGRNYGAHAVELKNEIPEAPVIFLKPQNALLTEGKPFYYPDFSKNIHYEGELVLRIAKNGKCIEEKFASKYFDAVTVGIDFTARDLQDYQKAKGLPWEIAKAFDHSAVIGNFIPITEEQKESGFQFSLHKNGKEVQKGKTEEMINSFNRIISYASNFFSLNIGDLIFTGTPSGVGPIAIHDNFEGYLGDQRLLQVTIK